MKKDGVVKLSLEKDDKVSMVMQDFDRRSGVKLPDEMETIEIGELHKDLENLYSAKKHLKDKLEKRLNDLDSQISNVKELLKDIEKLQK